MPTFNFTTSLQYLKLSKVSKKREHSSIHTSPTNTQTNSCQSSQVQLQN